YNESSQQAEHNERVLNRLDHEKGNWFETNINKMDVTTNFLQHCLFPRCKFTASDALYCSKFVHLLHCLKTPNFSTLICFDRVRICFQFSELLSNYPFSLVDFWRYF